MGRKFPEGPRTGEKKIPVRFFFSLRLLKLLPLAATLVAVMVAPAMAQEEEEPNEISKVLGAIGLLELPKEPIDYSERSPLVVPPSRATSAVTSSRKKSSV